MNLKKPKAVAQLLLTRSTINTTSFFHFSLSPQKPTMSSTPPLESDPTVDSSSSVLVPTPTVDSSIVVVENEEEEDLKYGFKRDEMYKDKFPIKSDEYDRHVFLSYKTASSWPPRVEDQSYDPLPSLFADSFKSNKSQIGKTRITVIEGESDGDVLIFPDMVKYKSLSTEEVDEFVKEVLVNKKTWSKQSPEELSGFHVFVCAHASRDKRCGVCGPVLVDKLNEEIGLRGLKGEIFVRPCSHVGGHKYAGNVIVFGAGSDGKVKGHWYGYVTPDDVPLLLDQHIGKGEVVEHLWRGEVCHPYEEKAEETEQKPKESDGVSLPNGTHFEKTEGETQGSSPKGMRQNGGGCCQGANGGTCYQDDSVELENKVAGKKPREGNGVCTRGVDKVSSWMGKLDQADAYTAVGVIGAVATVAVAYSIYRRSG